MKRVFCLRRTQFKKKQEVINEFKDKFNSSKSMIVIDARGLTALEYDELRNLLRISGSIMKTYKNTLARRGLNELNINIDEYLEGPSTFTFDEISAIKALDSFKIKHKALEFKVGIVDGNITDTTKLSQLASIPSREGLLTMLAGGMIQTVKDLSIALDLYAKKQEN